MRHRVLWWLSVVLGAAPAWAQGADSGAFVTRLGSDTIAVERFVRTADSVWGEVVVREPLVTREQYVARLDGQGNVTSYVIGSPNGRIAATFHPDSVTVVSKNGGTATQKTQPLAFGWKPGRYVVPLAEPTYGLHELLVMRAQAQAGSRVPFEWYYVGDFPDTGTVWARGDSAWIATPTDTIRMKVDPQGRIESSTDPGGTLQAEVTRVSGWPDLGAVASASSLGTLSPRGVARGTIGGANVVVDYGRPSRRGRVVFGNVVPFHAVWRMGANAATTMIIDHDLMFGGASVPAGTYTLFSYITPKGWDLIVNKDTGEWGTDYKHHLDLVRVPMRLDRSASPPVEQFTVTVQSDRIEMAWDTWKATLPLRASSVAMTGQ